MAVLDAAPDISRHENPWALPNRLAAASLPLLDSCEYATGGRYSEPETNP
jgi:hypothetical protein